MKSLSEPSAYAFRSKKNGFFGIALLEAMSADPFYIVSNGTGWEISCVMDHEHTALVFENQSHKSLTEMPE